MIPVSTAEVNIEEVRQINIQILCL